MEVTIRNELFIQYEPVVKWAIRHNRQLIRALRLDTDDVYQDFCIAAMKAIEGFDSQKSDSLKTHLVSRLQYEARNLKRRYIPHGVTSAKDVEIIFCSVDYHPEGSRQIEIPIDAEYALVEYYEALSLLSPDEREVVEERADGFSDRRNEQLDLVAAAKLKLSQYYERSSVACY